MIREAWYLDKSWPCQHKQSSRKGRRTGNHLTSASVWRDNQSVLTRWFYGSLHPPSPSPSTLSLTHTLRLCWRSGHRGAILVTALRSLRRTGSRGTRVYACRHRDALQQSSVRWECRERREEQLTQHEGKRWMDAVKSWWCVWSRGASLLAQVICLTVRLYGLYPKHYAL